MKKLIDLRACRYWEARKLIKQVKERSEGTLPFKPVKPKKGAKDNGYSSFHMYDPVSEGKDLSKLWGK